ncbi:flagellar hook protein FlgE [Microvirga sp. GCM10011540]|uniref:flagellar hook protein FlgE n=1 Tax=Microvirga sp. GCM10011540 TaxID=3317338 RepID=UPI003618536B
MASMKLASSTHLTSKLRTSLSVHIATVAQTATSGATMSLYGIMKAGVSGMNAQSTKLSTVADNIQNQNTAGYKRASTEFASMVIGSNKNSYNAGGVTTSIRYAIGQQGPVQYTSSVYDLAIQGNGFFAVRDAAGSNAMTRAGAFVPVTTQADDGSVVTRLMNTAGYQLLGQKLPATGLPGSMAEMVPVEYSMAGMQASVSTQGTFKANLPKLAADGDVLTSSMVVYDPLGTPITLEMSLEKTGASTWELTVRDRGDATLTPPRAPSDLTTSTLTFDPSIGELTGPADPLTFNVPHATDGPASPFSLNLEGMTQLSADFTPYETTADGSGATAMDSVEFASDGTLYCIYADGTRVPTYRIPLASVASPDRLSVESGNVFSETQESGRIQFGMPESIGYGSLQSGALEGSNVDLGAELASMIEAQSAYTANSKIFQAGSELIDVLVNLKR